MTHREYIQEIIEERGYFALLRSVAEECDFRATIQQSKEQEELWRKRAKLLLAQTTYWEIMEA